MKQFKAFFAAVVMIMTSQVIMAQTTVKGVLMDETLNEAEPFATIRVFKAGKTEGRHRWRSHRRRRRSSGTQGVRA